MISGPRYSLGARLSIAAVTAMLAASPAAGQGDTTRMPSPAAIAEWRWARVTYLSGPYVYVDAGTATGLREGTRLEVVRAGSVVATLAVAYVSSTRASCIVVSSTLPVAVGDSARFTPQPVVEAPAPRREATAAQPGPVSVRRPGGGARPLHGRLGVRYLIVAPGAGFGTLTQPALDARLDGRPWDGPLSVALDIRAHRTRRTGTAAPMTAGETRVYQAALHLQGDGRPARLSLGRQFATAVSAIGLFDGVAADLAFSRWSTGVFGGTQPDPIRFGYSPLIREYGAWLQARNAPGSAGVWSLTSALVGSYQGGEINREFVYLQGLVVRRRLSLYAAQEIDYNRGWKADAGERGTTPTSTFATVRLSPVDALAFTAGFDNRRSVRLYRDWISPETEFDDSFRRGIWGGVNATIAQHVQLAADVRSSDGGPAGRAGSRSASAGLVDVTPLRLGLRARATNYSGQSLSGTLQSASVEISPVRALRLEINGGMRRDVTSAVRAPSTLRWFGGDADLAIGRSLYLMISTQHESRGAERARQSYTALSWRF